jgi:hypothetical protein
MRSHLSQNEYCRKALNSEVQRTAKRKARSQSTSLSVAPSPSAVPAELPPSPNQPDFGQEWLQDTHDFGPTTHHQNSPAFEGLSTDAQRADTDMLGDAEHGGMFIEPFPGPAGHAFGKKDSVFGAMMRAARQNAVKNNVEWEKARWSPFASREEWLTAEWMTKRLGKNEVDEFLQLPEVSSLRFAK